MKPQKWKWKWNERKQLYSQEVQADLTLPIGRIGNPIHGSSQRPFFVWSWTSRVYTCWNSAAFCEESWVFVTIPRLNSGCAKIAGIHFSYPRNLGRCKPSWLQTVTKRMVFGGLPGCAHVQKMQSIVWIVSIIYSFIYLLIHISSVGVVIFISITI